MRRTIILLLAAVMLFCLISPGMAAWGKSKAGEADAAPVQEKIIPKKAEVDTNGDGKADRVETYRADGVIDSVKSDTNYDGTYDEWLYYEKGKLIKAAKDTDGDGKEDTWLTY